MLSEAVDYTGLKVFKLWSSAHTQM